MSTSSSSTTPQSLEWLGLLKWSLSYTDGTSKDNLSPMSAEDRAFLEKVMKDGIVNESERMKEILSQLTLYVEQVTSTTTDSRKDVVKEVEEIQNVLMELRDIVGLIDYAKMFTVMGGLSFLMGMATTTTTLESTSSSSSSSSRKGMMISMPIKTTCMIVLATLCQNNPFVQQAMLDQGHLVRLIQLFISLVQDGLQTKDEEEKVDDDKGVVLLFLIRIVQTISATVRDFIHAEEVFCQNEYALRFMEYGFKNTWLLTKEEEEEEEDNSSKLQMLQQKTLFFLQALLTSDSSNPVRLNLFQTCLEYIIQHFLLSSSFSSSLDVELREMTLSLLLRIYQRQWDLNLNDNIRLRFQEYIIQRVESLSSSSSSHELEDQDNHEELQLCQEVYNLLLTRRRTLSTSSMTHEGNSTVVGVDNTTSSTTPLLMILPASADKSHETLAQ